MAYVDSRMCGINVELLDTNPKLSYVSLTVFSGQDYNIIAVTRPSPLDEDFPYNVTSQTHTIPLSCSTRRCDGTSHLYKEA